MDILSLQPGDPRYPATLQAFEQVAAIGSPLLLQHKKLALFCSRRCPGGLILKAHEWAQGLCQEGLVVVSGFHTPVEQECLRLFLRNEQPVILCPARSIEGMRIPSAYRQPLHEGRLLILSPFAPANRRATQKQAATRNEMVVQLADVLFVVHAASGSGTAHLGQDAMRAGKAVFTLDHSDNAHLLEAGVQPVTRATWRTL